MTLAGEGYAGTFACAARSAARMLVIISVLGLPPAAAYSVSRNRNSRPGPGDLLSYALESARKIGSGRVGSSRELIWGRAPQLATCKVGIGPGRGPRVCIRCHATASGQGAAGHGRESKGSGVLHVGRIRHGERQVIRGLMLLQDYCQGQASAQKCASSHNASSSCWAQWDQDNQPAGRFALASD